MRVRSIEAVPFKNPMREVVKISTGHRVAGDARRPDRAGRGIGGQVAAIGKAGLARYRGD